MKAKTKKTGKRKDVPRENEQLLALGVAFRNRRLDLKLNFIELAEKSGISSLTLSLFERGELKNASLITLGKIAGALGMEINVTAEVKKNLPIFPKSYKK